VQSKHKKVQGSPQVLIVALVGDDMTHTNFAISPMLGMDFSSLNVDFFKRNNFLSQSFFRKDIHCTTT
jgi:hypothetical protein